MTTTMPLPPEFDAEARAIDEARTAAYAALRAANARGLRGSDVDAFDEALRAVAARCEALRRRYLPNRYRLVVIDGQAMTISPKGYTYRIVWNRASRERSPMIECGRVS